MFELYFIAICGFSCVSFTLNVSRKNLLLDLMKMGQTKEMGGNHTLKDTNNKPIFSCVNNSPIVETCVKTLQLNKLTI